MPELCTERRALDVRLGQEGLLLFLRKLLRRPRVQSVHISAAGVETSFVGEPGERLFPAQEEDEIFSGFYQSVRAAHAKPLGSSSDPYSMLLRLFRELDNDGLVLRAILLGDETIFWNWSGCTRKSTYMGYPVIYDADLPSTCVSFLGAVDALSPLSAVERTYVSHITEQVTP